MRRARRDATRPDPAAGLWQNDAVSEPSSSHTLPTPGPALPRRGNVLVRAVFAAVLRLTGWRFVGDLPDRAKLVIVAAPHTSNWDFVIGMCGVFALGLDLHWMGKHTLFRPPFGGVMRWLGGLAIDRTAAHGVVEQMVDQFQSRTQLLLVVTPEGTRSRVMRWKTGFWHVARSARVPILLAAIDYRHKQLQFGPLLDPGASLDADLATIRAYYRGITPRHPEQF
jgi:1-acyl-sn-glycerol-3-phosphate acyltransferase